MDIPVKTIVLYSILGAAFFIYVPFLLVAYRLFQTVYNIAASGAMFDRLLAYAQRAKWAHQKSFKAFIIFATVVFMAYTTNVDKHLAAVAAISSKNETIIANFDNITRGTPLEINVISDIDGDLDKELSINASSISQPVFTINVFRKSQLATDFLNNQAMKLIVEARNGVTSGTFLENSLILKTDVKEFGTKTISGDNFSVNYPNNRQTKLFFNYGHTKLQELLKAYNSGAGSYFQVMIALSGDAATTLTYDDISLVPYSLPLANHYNWAYGNELRQVLDFYQAKPINPNQLTPVVFDIHGGGFVRLNKGIKVNIAELVGNGISVVQMNYRYVQEAYENGIDPPIELPMSDIISAIEFILNRADELNIDKNRIGLTGGSAGGHASLLLGLTNDYDFNSGIKAIAPRYAQTTMDPVLMRQWLNPNNNPTVEANIIYGSHLFGYHNPNMPSTQQEKIAFFNQWIEDRNQNNKEMFDQIVKYSANYQVTSNDPAVFLDYAATNVNQNSDYTHHPLFGVNLYNLLQNAGVESYLRLDNHPTPYSDYIDFLIEKL